MWLCPSLPLAILFLGLVFGTFYSFTVGVMVRKGGSPGEALVLVAVLSAAYLAAAMYRMFPIGGVVLPPHPSNPEQRRLADALEKVCRRAGVAVPCVVLRVDPAPNLCSCGFYFGACCLYVNQGLLRTLTDPDELSGALAHEIAHIARFDTFLFCLLRPLFWAANFFLGLTHLLFFGFRKVLGGVGMSPLLPMMLLSGGRGGGCGGCGAIGCLMVLFVFMGLAMLTTMVFGYGVLAMAVLLALTAACQVYLRYAEEQADLQAVRTIGDGDAVLYALARAGMACPGEAANLDKFAAAHLGPGYGLLDVLRCLKNGGDPAAGIPLRQRLLRSHPLLTERFACIIRAFGTRIV